MPLTSALRGRCSRSERPAPTLQSQGRWHVSAAPRLRMLPSAVPRCSLCLWGELPFTALLAVGPHEREPRLAPWASFPCLPPRSPRARRFDLGFLWRCAGDGRQARCDGGHRDRRTDLGGTGIRYQPSGGVVARGRLSEQSLTRGTRREAERHPLRPRRLGHLPRGARVRLPLGALGWGWWSGLGLGLVARAFARAQACALSLFWGAPAGSRCRGYSHSMVAGGLLEMS